MGLAKSVMFMVVLMAWFGVSSGVLYTVGDVYGWNNYTSVDYMTWASSKQFHVGDFIRFKYDPRVDNVVRVTHVNFRACNATNPISVASSGEDIVAVRNPHSHLFFISTAPGHCEAGQKVDIRVFRPSHNSGSGSGPGLGPAPSPSSPSDISSPDESASALGALPSTATALLLLVATSLSYYLC